jgi:hypothetical protein
VLIIINGKEVSFRTNTGENIIRVCITSIAKLNPITAALAEAYDQLSDEKKWRYVEEFFQNFTDELKLHEDKINELDSRTDPDEILHLMLIAVEKVQFEYQEERRKKYAGLIVNSILLENEFNFDKKRMFIQLFSELSDDDIIYLGEFYNESKKPKFMGSEPEVQLNRFGSNLLKTVPYVKRLESRGLVYQVLYPTITYLESDTDTDFDDEWKKKAYAITPLGADFCKFIID